MPSMDYLTVKQFTEHTELVKGSRFIAWVAPIEREQDATELVEKARSVHPDASHHCSAWRFGEVLRFSDDGEPGGTAGRPMLEVLLRRDLHNSVAVVTRYFGGTKLGAGGLVRAYSGAVAKALDLAGERLVRELGSVRATVPFALVDSVLRFVADQPDVRTVSSDFGAEGLELEVEMPTDQLPAFRESLVDLSRADVKLHD